MALAAPAPAEATPYGTSCGPSYVGRGFSRAGIAREDRDARVTEPSAVPAVTLSTREDPPDERDRLIEGRAVRAAYSLLTIGAYAAICHVLINGKLYPLVNNAWFGPYMTVHVIFLFAIASEALKMSLQLYYYRRGVA